MALWQKRWPFKTIETLYKVDFSRELFMYVWALTLLNIYIAVTRRIGCCWKMCFYVYNCIFVSDEQLEHWKLTTINNNGNQAGHSNSKQTMTFKSWRWRFSPSLFDKIVILIELSWQSLIRSSSVLIEDTYLIDFLTLPHVTLCFLNSSFHHPHVKTDQLLC